LGTLDLTNNAAILPIAQVGSSASWVDVTTIGGTAIGTVNSYLTTAFNNGWTGVGIISQGNPGPTPPKDDTAYNGGRGNYDTGLLAITKDDYQNGIGYGSTFFHADLTPYANSAVLIRYTYLGDSDFDGGITAADVSTVLGSYFIHATPTILNGTTVYGQEPSGHIDANDVSTVLGEYFLHETPYNPPASAGGITPVPEPSTIVLLLLAGLAFVLRRRFR
jgi:hypothetical protein